MSLETIENMKTKWEGLWYKEQSRIYSSPVFNVSDLKKFKGRIRFLVRKNRFYQKGTNRPNMQFMICESTMADMVYDKDIRMIKNAFIESSFIKIDDAIEVARRMLRDMEYGYSIDDLIVEVVGFMEEKIVTPEEILSMIEDGDEYE